MEMKNYYRAYTMEYGTFVGLAWSVAFLSYVYGLCGANALLLMLCLVFCGVSILLPFFLAMRLRHMMIVDGAGMSYWQGLMFAFSMFMYACLFNGLIVYGYFEVLDDGVLIDSLSKMIVQQDMKQLYEQMGMAEQYKEIQKMLDELAGLGAFDKALLMFNNNFFWSLLWSVILALVVRTKPTK